MYFFYLYVPLLFSRTQLFNNIVNKINEKLGMPSWHTPSLQCTTDDDCPVPFACCHDAFFPMKTNYCCINYKKREYSYSYEYIK